MSQSKNYYEILGVEQTASLENIIKAKDRLNFGDSEDRAPFSMWEKIDEAYKVLADSTEREKYDQLLNQQTLDVYSNSNGESSSVFNSSDLDNDIDQNQQGFSNIPKKISSFVKTTKEYVEGSEILPKLAKVGKKLILAVPTGVLATITIIKELNKRENYKLEKESIEKKVEAIKTPEDQLEEKYIERLENKIIRRLNEYYYNYDYEIDKARIEMRIELLKERIKQKENQVVKKYQLLKYKLELTSLMKQLEVFEQSLSNINKKIEENNKNKSKQKLTELNDKLISVNMQINELSNSTEKKTFSLKRLEARKRSLEKAKNAKIQKQKTNREIYGIFRDSIVSAHARTENFVESLFVPMEEIDNRIKTH